MKAIILIVTMFLSHMSHATSPKKAWYECGPNSEHLLAQLRSDDVFLRLEGRNCLASFGEIVMPWISIQLSERANEVPSERVTIGLIISAKLIGDANPKALILLSQAAIELIAKASVHEKVSPENKGIARSILETLKNIKI